MLLPARAPCLDKKKRVRTRIASRLSLMVAGVRNMFYLKYCSASGFAFRSNARMSYKDAVSFLSARSIIRSSILPLCFHAENPVAV